MFWKLGLFLVILLTSFFASAQGDTSVYVQVIEISDYKLRANNLGGTSQNLQVDRTTTTNLSNILSERSGVFIKNYGPGSIATSSIRGGSANHTLVLWNDLPIQNPYLGLLDLSLISSSAVDRITLHKGGNSAMWGSGAIGAVINMEQKNIQSSDLLIYNLLTIGAFGKIQERVKASIKFGKFRSTTTYDFLQAENDFSFQVSPGDIRKQSNAQQKQINFNQDLYFKPNSSNELAFHLWHSSADRQVPPLTTQRTSQAYQIDNALRLSGNWTYHGAKMKVKTNLGYFDENLDYYDPSIALSSLTNFTTFISDLNLSSKRKGMHKYDVGLSYVRNKVTSLENYAEDPKENRVAAFGRYMVSHKKLKIQLSARQELVNGMFIPIMPNFEFEYRAKNEFVIKSKVSRNYRLPSLNDRFWKPGGNPNLLPEAGWSQEVTAEWKTQKPSNKLYASITGFNKIIDNWIQWGLLEGTMVWSAYNLTKVWSRGLEPRLGIDIIKDNRELKIDLGYDYVLSTNQVSATNPSIAKGDQLWYTPIHSAFTNVGISVKSISGNYNHRWVGSTTGINDDLDAFSLANFDLAWEAKLKKVGFKLIARINNIWNTNYRIVERRPMPGRNFELGINLKYTK